MRETVNYDPYVNYVNHVNYVKLRLRRRREIS